MISSSVPASARESIEADASAAGRADASFAACEALSYSRAGSAAGAAFAVRQRRYARNASTGCSRDAVSDG